LSFDWSKKLLHYTALDLGDCRVVEKTVQIKADPLKASSCLFQVIHVERCKPGRPQEDADVIVGVICPVAIGL
jgi:hypothetical protein